MLCHSITGNSTYANAFLSLAEQSLRDFELIVVDDGSADASLTIAKELEEHFANLRIVCQQHEFAGAATESLDLLEEAYADYAAFELGLLRRQSDLPASISTHVWK